MAERRPSPPGSLNHLQRLLTDLARSDGRPFGRIQRALANAIVGQMLPPSVVKGGTGMKLRVGEKASRFTPDLDAARPAGVDADAFIAELQEQLATGWSGFTGTVAPMEQRRPENVPDEYIMVPFQIALAYTGKLWLNVILELGHDEVGSTLVAEPLMPDDIVEVFRALGLPDPDPIPVMAVEHQVAQKLHACTWVSPGGGRNQRAHDLVDLQILDQEGAIDLATTRAVALRLFASRRAQIWPPIIQAFDEWDTIYNAAAEGLEVLPTVTAAIDWANRLVSRIDAAGPITPLP